MSHPATLGDYTLVELIGRGGMGEVWRAEGSSVAGVRRRLAIKRILPQFQHDPVLRERFIAEARITARLEHPHIVQLVHFADVPEPFLVLEYVDGISAAELLRRAALRECALPVAAALFIVAEAADALDYAHRRTDDSQRPLGIVHRDVSPPNILLSFDGVVKVNDFGVARAADNIVRTQAGLSVGKIVYMAPEQARGEPVDKRADVFSLGVVLWELLALEPLLPRNQPAAVVLDALNTCKFPAPSTRARGIPPVVDTIVREALARAPDARTPSAGRLATALRTALHDLVPGFDQRELARVIRTAAPDRARLAATTEASIADVDFAQHARVSPAPASASRLAPTPPVGSPRISPQIVPMPPTEIASAPQSPRSPYAASPIVSPAPSRWKRVIAPLMVFVALLVGAGIWFALRESPEEEPLAASFRPQLQAVLPSYLVACGTTYGPMPNGRVAADVTFGPNGRVTGVQVRVNDNHTPTDQTIARCVESYFAGVGAPASARGFTIENLSYAF